MTRNTFAQLVATWIRADIPQCESVVRFGADGELKVVLPAPRGSRAGELIILTDKGNLWIGLGVRDALYAIDSRRELASVAKQLLNDRVLFVVTHKGQSWIETTLIRRGRRRSPKSGETVQLVSWSGGFDQLHRAIFKKPPRKRSLRELKEGIRERMRRRYGRP